MARIHEIVAVERQAQSVAAKLLQESVKTLGKDSLFRGATRTLRHASEDDRHFDTEEHHELETTVGEVIDYTRESWANWVDLVYRKDLANGEAAADLVVDGNTIAENVPATTLLGLEAKLADFRKVFDAIPTLPAGTNWIPDEQSGEGVWRSQNPEVTLKEVKIDEFQSIAAATEHHPEQVAKVQRKKTIGKYETNHKCGMMTSLEKAQQLQRLDKMLAAVKQARSRANGQEVPSAAIGGAIFDYIRGD